MKKSKHMTGKAFSPQVCDAIRHHIGERKVLESRRSIAFEDRDAAVEEKSEFEDHSSPEYLECCRRHSEAIADIDRLSAGIKWHRNQVDGLVEKADEPQLDFMYDPPAEPARKSAGQLKLADAEEAEERPVGRRGRKATTPHEPESPAVEGVAEHLRASVNELECSENCRNKLIAAGITTIGRVLDIIDGPNDLRELLNCGESVESQIRRAAKAYRKAHNHAEVESEREALA